MNSATSACRSFCFLFFSETGFHSAAVADLALPVEIKLDFH